jgi:hypothetical protein
MNDIQHVCVKILAQPGAIVDWPELIPVFHRWIQESALPGLLIDVADYAHVPAGPGMLIIGHEAHYAVDNGRNELGLLYNRRMPLEGSLGDKLECAYDSALTAARRIEKEPQLATLRFNERECDVFVNDRLMAPNTEDTFKTLGPEIEGWFGKRWGTSVKIDWNGDQRGLFRVRVRG